MLAGVLAAIGTMASGARAQRVDAAITVGSSDLGGVVTSRKGPEAGVWVIAETIDTPTRYTKIVVTDD
ncbi:MAG TPA: hypothetical protein VGF76_19380, partial [Polyangiaceae bacterium]